jgi:hypothetical protein
MKKVWLIGLAVNCLAGATIVACGSSSGTTGGTGGTSTTTTTGPTTTTTSSGVAGGSTTTTTTTSGTGGTGGTGSTTSTSGTGGSECGKVSTLHPPKAGETANVYCPFSTGGPDGGTDYCTGGMNFCCETAEGSATPSSCVTGTPSSANCPNAFVTSSMSGSTVWECEQPSDCPAATPVCCAVGYGYGGTSPKTASITLGAPGCGNYASEMGGTVCSPAGACANGFTMCSNPDNSECTGIGSGVCTPFEKAGAQVGGCM